MKRTALVQLHRTIVPIRALPAALAGMRIIHLSDLHMSTWTSVAEETRRLLGTVDFDLLIVTGDFSHHPPHWQKTLDLMARFFDPIASAAPIYAVLGNHDLPELAEHHRTPIRFLRNESTIIRVNGAYLKLAGVEQTYGLLPRSEQALSNLQQTLAAPPDAPGDQIGATNDDLATILLAHFPSTVYTLPTPAGQGRPGHIDQPRSAADAVDLVLSGHTHGGQIRLPGLGCLWANDAIPLRFARGLHRVEGTLLHTSAGIGVSGPLRLRINCPPELTLLSLQPQRFIGPAAGDDAQRPTRELSRV